MVVTGKGGVGRSTVAAGLGRYRSRRGERVLVVDATATGGPGLALGWTGPVPPGEIVEIPDREALAGAGSLSLLRLSTQHSLEEYLRLTIKLAPGVRTLGPVARIFDYVATAAPAVREILSIGKIGNEVRKGVWDAVVVDGPATGHVVELLTAPDALSQLVGRGPLLGETRWLSELLADPQVTSALVVSLAEELVVNETLELVDRLRAETSVRLAGIVANRLAPVVDGTGQVETTRLRSDGHPWAGVAALAVERGEHGLHQRERLTGPGLPVLAVADEPGQGVAAVMAALAASGW